MSFTIILALLGLFGLLVVFAIAYKVKGLKAAFLIAASAAVVFAVLYVLIISAIVSQM